ncbi:MAG: hypothetical protein KZQ95_18250 [Candidatus Thiodiazotropha sp. (ex Epidulcina cf. delphinae)]|nr:hypothetical protein [Candidatus Thiodiazotropha sp. (ex Epidulcina cf. delphinae)]MCU7927556.1 hypothetical protein [Candidatus Thiodiazotropha sp. (ex Dulcina madagascariensis)]
MRFARLTTSYGIPSYELHAVDEDSATGLVAETPFNGYPCPKCQAGHLPVIGEQPPVRWKGG